MKNTTVAFIGLGVMGYPMAGHVLQSGYQIRVFNRNRQKAESWLQDYNSPGYTTQAVICDSIADACQYADVVLTCVGNDDDLAQVMLGDAAVLANCKPGALLCDHTTSSAKMARMLSVKAAEADLLFLDAPVSGGQVGAQKGSLSIMVGGDIPAFEQALPVMSCYGKTIRRIGDSGSGQLAKMVNQICITGILQGLSEALFFAQKAELDVEKVLEVISQGAAQSWQMENRASTMLKEEFDFGFAVDWMRKDLAFVLDEAQSMQIDLQLVKQVDSYYQELQAMGGGRWDTSSLIQRLRKSAGA
jgi:3-hydroxyisobutyrate dehydrogenase